MAGGAVSLSVRLLVHFHFREAILKRDLHINQLELLVVLAADWIRFILPAEVVTGLLLA